MITIEGVDPRMIANNLTPFEPTHPGELLKEELLARGIFQMDFAKIIDVPYTALNEILNGKRPMSVDFSMRVEAALGISSEWFLNMQTDYNMQTARKDPKLSERLEAIRNLAASMTL
jgi:addiction module HigA family antidote